MLIFAIFHNSWKTQLYFPRFAPGNGDLRWFEQKRNPLANSWKRWFNLAWFDWKWYNGLLIQWLHYLCTRKDEGEILALYEIEVTGFNSYTLVNTPKIDQSCKWLPWNFILSTKIRQNQVTKPKYDKFRGQNLGMLPWLFCRFYPDPSVRVFRYGRTDRIASMGYTAFIHIVITNCHHQKSSLIILAYQNRVSNRARAPMMTHWLMTGQTLHSAGQLPQAVSANHGGGQRSCDLNPWDPSQRQKGSRRTCFSLATTVCCANWDWTNKTQTQTQTEVRQDDWWRTQDVWTMRAWHMK